MDNGYAHWYPYEKETRYYGKETYESKESMKSFLYEDKFANNIANVQKYVIPSFKAKGSKEHLCSEKKERNKESARSQEVMLDKNDTCEGTESHDRIEGVEESEGISIEHCFLDAIPSLFQKIERDESEIWKKEKWEQ
ncbi:hypothetical protein M9H77_23413 [Catharanthus roseus]|uniref:Uncharacterized protein n=1 Tax=Catharanthus roseus TaxID=4058 RepID=A0ACC0ATA5_CATRO|nr:hypothetical protein M9H77_23413 [Catharanthus roseus]